MGSPGGIPVSRLRPSALTAGFGLLFAAIAALAVDTALATRGPWYDATVSVAVYALALVLGTLLAVVLVVQASGRARSFESSLRRLDRRIAILRAAPVPPPVDEHVHHIPVPRDLEAELDAFEGGASSVLVGSEREGHDTLVPLVRGTGRAIAPARSEVLRLLVRERIGLREAQARVWSLAAGPVGLCVVFLAIAGPMLPGAGAFAAAHYQLNTALVLFLAYGFAPLVAWSVLSLGILGGLDRRAMDTA